MEKTKITTSIEKKTNNPPHLPSNMKPNPIVPALILFVIITMFALGVWGAFAI